MTTLFARFLSIALHPFVMVGILVSSIAVSRGPTVDAIRTVTLVVSLTILPVIVLMIRQVRRGAWANADASNADERPILFLVVAVALAVLLGFVMAHQPQSFMMRGIIASLSMVAVCAVVTRWVKVSLHMAFATFTVTTLALAHLVVGYVLVLSLPPLMWSRLFLQRHTMTEVALGGAIGAFAGAAVHWW